MIRLKQMIQEALGDSDPNQMTVTQVLRMVQKKFPAYSAKGRRVGSFTSMLNLVRAEYAALRARGISKEGPAAVIRPGPAKIAVALKPEEVNAVLRALHHYYEHGPAGEDMTATMTAAFQVSKAFTEFKDQ